MFVWVDYKNGTKDGDGSPEHPVDGTDTAHELLNEREIIRCKRSDLPEGSVVIRQPCRLHYTRRENMFTRFFNWLCNKTIRPYLLKALTTRFTPHHEIKNKAHGKLFDRGYAQAVSDMRMKVFSVTGATEGDHANAVRQVFRNGYIFNV